VQRHRNKIIYIIQKRAARQSRVSQKTESFCRLSAVSLERKYHFPKTRRINARPCNRIKGKLLPFAAGTTASRYPVFAYVPAAPFAVITAAYSANLLPAAIAQLAIYFENNTSAIDAPLGPKQMI
jgi:hypothetical protein